MRVSQILLDLVDRFHQRLLPLYDSLREDRFFLLCYLTGSYVVVQILFNTMTGLAPLCGSGPACQFPSYGVLLLGVVTILGGTLKRLADLELVRIHGADADV